MYPPDKINPPTCSIPKPPDYSGVTIVPMNSDMPLADYRQAMRLANAKADELLGDAMLLAWYDRDRDFESPQHASECHVNSATPGYVDYALYHGATLKLDFEEGRFVFFYLPINLNN